MTTYILLRSNKESGPFSLEQMAGMGLKPNDLIWVEGQSASWRNPHEIRELSSLVTEPGQKKETSGNGSAATESTTPAGKRAVFVALPKAGSVPVETVAPEPKKEGPGMQKSYAPVEEISAKPKEEVETKYAMSLDEIKERYVRSLDERKARKRMQLDVPPGIKKLGTYAAVFVLGAMIVLLLMRPNSVSNISTDQRKLPASFDTREETASTPADEEDVVLPESYYDSHSEGNEAAGRITEEVKTPSRSSQKTRQPDIRTDVETAPADSQEEHTVSIPRNEKPEIRTVAPVDISDQVSVRTNGYTIAALGGIRDLELTLNNNSEYTLDKVTVEIRYLSPNGNIIRTEDVNFRSVHPNGTQTIAVKKSNRGVKVSHKITRIESREIATQTAGIE